MDKIIETYVRGIIDLIHLSEQEPDYVLIEKIITEDENGRKRT